MNVAEVKALADDIRREIGKAVIGHKAGERVYIKLSEDDGYWLDILKIEKGSDVGSIPIRGY